MRSCNIISAAVWARSTSLQKITDILCIEVKYRRDKSCGHPAEAVTPRKQRTISKVASYYLLTHGCGMDTPCRFDVAAVSGDEVELIKNAFEYQGYL